MQGAGCRVQGAGFRVQGSGFRVQGGKLLRDAVALDKAFSRLTDGKEVAVTTSIALHPQWVFGSLVEGNFEGLRGGIVEI